LHRVTRFPQKYVTIINVFFSVFFPDFGFISLITDISVFRGKRFPYKTIGKSEFFHVNKKELHFKNHMKIETYRFNAFISTTGTLSAC
jgi:hypothetical protein